MKGDDVTSSIFGLLGGDTDSSSLDGLRSMLASSLSNAAYKYNYTPSDKTLTKKIENVLDQFGLNPYTKGGQSAVEITKGLYHVSPDLVGTLIGIPNYNRFFSTIANGANGINQASGNGSVDIFNPYSVEGAYNRAVDMAKTIQGVALRENGGYNVNFSHGLNMNELGLVSQRFLSSKLAYNEYEKNGEETGRTLNLIDHKDAEKFKNNLSNLGSKFNDAASMLSKITGSVEEALQLMDKLGNGNFLGGSAKKATDIANRAMRMATTIRVASAIAGEDPKQMYQAMGGIQNVMLGAMGVDPNIAHKTGFANALLGNAYTATLAYAGWSAMNPNASSQEREQALASVQYRAGAYQSSTGSSMAALVALNKNMFSQEELEGIRTAFKEGRPEDYKNLVRDRIGHETFDKGINDPRRIVINRRMASEKNSDLLADLDSAGMEGGLNEAGNVGRKDVFETVSRDFFTTMSNKKRGKEMSIWNVSRLFFNKDSSLGEKFDDAVDFASVNALRSMAQNEGSLSDNMIYSMNSSELRSYLSGKLGADGYKKISKAEKDAQTYAARNQIYKAMMSPEQQKAAIEKLKQAIKDSGVYSDDQKKKLFYDLSDPSNFDAVYNDFIEMLPDEQKALADKNIKGGKISKEEAEDMVRRLDLSRQDDSKTNVDNAIRSEREKMAKKSGLNEEYIRSMSDESLRTFLVKRYDSSMIDKLDVNAAAQALHEEINKNTMTDDDEQIAIDKVKDEALHAKHLDEAGRKDILEKVRSGDLSGALNLLTAPLSDRDARDLRNKITGGKFTSFESKIEHEKISQAATPFSDKYTKEERMATLRNNAKKFDFQRQGKLFESLVNVKKGNLHITKDDLEKNPNELMKIAEDELSVNKRIGTVSENAGFNWDYAVGDLTSEYMGKQASFYEFNEYSRKEFSEKYSNKVKEELGKGKSLKEAYRIAAKEIRKSGAPEGIDKNRWNDLWYTLELKTETKDFNDGVNNTKLLSKASESIGDIDERTINVFDRIQSTVYDLASKGEISFYTGDARGEAIRQTVSDIVGSKLGNVNDADALDGIKSKITEEMYSSIVSGENGNVAFSSALSSLLADKDVISAIGENGVAQLKKWQEDASDKSSSLSESFLSNAALGSRMANLIMSDSENISGHAVDKIKEMTDKGFIGRGDFNEYFELAARTGNIKEEDEYDKKKAAIVDAIRQNAPSLNGDTLNAVAEEAIGLMGSESFVGNINTAVQEAMEYVATQSSTDDDQKNELFRHSDYISKDKDFGKKVAEASLKQIAPEGVRDNSALAAVSVAGGANASMLAMISANAAQSGLTFDAKEMASIIAGGKEGSVAMVSMLDRMQANAKQNKLSNAINVGGTSFRQSTIEGTKKMLSSISNELKDSGLSMTEETFKIDYDKNGALTSNYMEWLKNHEIEVTDENGVKTKRKLSDAEIKEHGAFAAAGFSSGGKDFFSKDNLNRMTEDDYLEFSKATAREGSDMVNVSKGIGKVLEYLGSICNGKALTVTGSVKIDK